MTMREAVVAVLRRADGRLLMIERGPKARMAGYWGFPSGTVEPGEDQPETLVREMREELGVAVAPLRKVWQCPADGVDYLLHWWTAEITEGVPAPDGAEVAEVRWVTAREFAKLSPTFPGDRPFFEDVLPTL
ncbi:NUDIX domain-containing protein [Streptomyces polyrhachis]|uniref:8-oxo-dGTP diphosphatase n=1 Tax=Streptomyces polyrhachis TaxID=1282885 RepID=A0ABW2GCC4_9ACTN